MSFDVERLDDPLTEQHDYHIKWGLVYGLATFILFTGALYLLFTGRLLAALVEWLIAQIPYFITWRHKKAVDKIHKEMDLI